MLRRVSDEVREDLLDPIGVPSTAQIPFDTQVDRARRVRRLDLSDDPAREGREVNLGALDRNPAAEARA